MFFDYSREAMYLLEEGVAPERIDRVMKEQFGFAMGPFATFDLSGVDVFWHIQHGHAAAFGDKRTNIIDRMYEAKRWGQKTGVGFYKYDGPNKRDPVPDPALLALAAEEAAKAGIAPRDVSDAEIVERLAYALVNVGAELLDKGIALRPGDEDIVYIYGYGFPPHHGGPIWYADEVGVAKVVARIKAFGWPVSPLLERIADSGGTIAGFRRRVPGTTINRYCASGLQAIGTAAGRVLVDGAKVVVAGGCESISMVQNDVHVKGFTEEWLLRHEPDVFMPMLQTADNLAKHYKISREAQDEYALASQQRTAAAQ